MAQSHQPEPQSALCLLTFHDAAELFLQLASEHLDVGKNQPSFMEYWDLLAQRVEHGVSQQESMRRLNKARVAFKHHGTLPSSIDIEGFRATVRNFFLDNCEPIFGLGFEQVDLRDLVDCARAQEQLTLADHAAARGEIDDSMENFALAFEFLVEDYEERKTSQFGRSPFFFGDDMQFLSSFFMNLDPSDRIADFVDKTRESITAMQQAIKVLSLGIDYRKYTKFKLLTPMVAKTLADDYYCYSAQELGRTLTDGDVRFCTDFVIESALRLQEFDYAVATADT